MKPETLQAALDAAREIIVTQCDEAMGREIILNHLRPHLNDKPLEAVAAAQSLYGAAANVLACASRDNENNVCRTCIRRLRNAAHEFEALFSEFTKESNNSFSGRRPASGSPSTGSAG